MVRTVTAEQEGDASYAREQLVPGWDQVALEAATAVVVGVGALGNEVAKNLALAGIGRLVLCDPDTVARSNLSRSVLLLPGDLGRAKAEAAAESLLRLRPDLIVETRVGDLAVGVGLGELADADVVLSCLDGLRSRMRLLGRCALVEAPLVDGGTGPWEGEVRLRLSTGESCYGCSLTEHQRSSSDVPWSCTTPTAGPMGASIAGTAVVASWMSAVALRLLLGAPAPAYRLLRLEPLTGRATPTTVERDPTCPHHRRLTGEVESVALGHDATVRELLEVLPLETEPLGWVQFPVPVHCRNCHGYAETTGDRPVQAGLLPTVCGRCSRLLRPRFSHRLRDAAADSKLCDVGVAPEEILPVRSAEGGYRWVRLTRMASRKTSPSPGATSTP